ncbi:MAG: YitT family protein [Erysipelotrichaceae bacterium]|nr:YitT family protein [Erysipelotrichaceae bacterium]
MRDFFDRATLRKMPLYLIFLALSELGIALYYTARVGTDPISVFVEGVSFHCDLSVGEISTICNVIFMIMTFFLYREVFGIGTFITTLLGGPLIDLFCSILFTAFPESETSIFARIMIIICGLIVYPIGLGGLIACDLGIGPFSFPPLYASKKAGIDLKYTQIINDAIYFLIGIFLGGLFGIGTIISVFLTGPMMEWFIKLIEPYIRKIEQGEKAG